MDGWMDGEVFFFLFASSVKLATNMKVKVS